MLVELAAINAAYGVIKEVVGNGRELYDCGAHLSSFFNNKAALQKKVNATPPGRRDEMEEFFALEKIKQQEEELKNLMIWTGRAGLWDDWLAFQAEAARVRREEAAKIERKALARRELIDQIFKVLGVIVLAAAAIVGLALIVSVTLKV